MLAWKIGPRKPTAGAEKRLNFVRRPARTTAAARR